MGDPNEYSHKDVLELTHFEHIRQNAAMYIGETKNPNHLLFEGLDNALDEAQAKCATIIGIIIDNKEGTCTISDNGRGIPFENDTITKIATRLFTGGKFKKGEESKSYKIASGLHGIGLVAITALSEWLSVIVYRDNKKATYLFEGNLVKQELIEDNESGKIPFSTQLTFKPHKNYFETTKFNSDAILERLKLASIHMDHLKIIFIVDGKKEIIDCDFNQYFKENLLGNKGIKTTPMFTIKQKVKDEEISLKFCWALEEISRKYSGCVNLLSVDQGTHINVVCNSIKNVFEVLRKKDKLTFQPDDALVGFRCHMNLLLYEPQFSSQTKERLVTSKDKLDHLLSGFEDKLLKVLNDNPEIRTNLLARFETYRKRLASKNSVIKSGANVSRFNNVIDSKLRDCTTHSIEKSELFITEGASASGTLTTCRDPRYHAVLSLKGKIPNIAGFKDFLKNNEIVEIINALGTGIEPDFTLSSLRYGKIIFATDADADGAHISSLLMIVMLKLVPKLLKQGSIYRAIMPLYGVTAGSRFIPFYTNEEMETYKAQHGNSKIERYKGLGEMDPPQLKICLLDEGTRKLKQITYPDNPEYILKLMLDAGLKRNLL